MAPRAADDGNLESEVSGLGAQLGFAVVVVVVFHVYQFCNTAPASRAGTAVRTLLNSLDAAIPWLFVIAGFLLFEPIARGITESGRPFAARRFLALAAARVLPAYYVAIVTVWLLRQTELPGDWRDLLEHLTFTQVFDNKRIFWTIGAAWALSVTAWFLLLLAAAGSVLTKVSRYGVSPRRRIVLLASSTAVLAVAALGWKTSSLVLGHPDLASFTTWFGPLANLDNFAIGMVVALFVVAGSSSGKLDLRGRLILRIGGSGLLIVALVTRVPGSWADAYFSTLCALAFGCLVAATVLGPGRNGSPSPGLGLEALRWLGRISLSVYLWHEPLLLAGRHLGLVGQTPDAFVRDALIVLIASILGGWLSWAAIERPVAHLIREFSLNRAGRAASAGSAGRADRADRAASAGSAGRAASRSLAPRRR